MSFSSGSCGNCYFLGYAPDGPQAPGTRPLRPRGVLIDAGVSFRRMKKALAVHSLGTDAVGAVLVTHDHFDHIRHLGAICKNLSVPVYATDKLHSALSRHSICASQVAPCRRILSEEEENLLPLNAYGAGFKVKCFEVPHDASQTVGFAIDFAGFKLVHITDAGRITEQALEYASVADAVVIEANYDRQMLLSGSYPADLKKRIADGNGHLSNDECAAAVEKFLHPGLKAVFLCHLSENNNTPELAFGAVAEVLERHGARENVALYALPRQYPSELFRL